MFIFCINPYHFLLIRISEIYLCKPDTGESMSGRETDDGMSHNYYQSCQLRHV